MCRECEYINMNYMNFICRRNDVVMHFKWIGRQQKDFAERKRGKSKAKMLRLNIKIIAVLVENYPVISPAPVEWWLPFNFPNNIQYLFVVSIASIDWSPQTWEHAWQRRSFARRLSVRVTMKTPPSSTGDGCIIALRIQNGLQLMPTITWPKHNGQENNWWRANDGIK